MQTSLFDTVHRIENNPESKSIFEANRGRLESQCKKVLRLFQEGKRLTVRSAMIEHGIGDLRRRCADLREAGHHIKSELIEGRFKEYFL